MESTAPVTFLNLITLSVRVSCNVRLKETGLDGQCAPTIRLALNHPPVRRPSRYHFAFLSMIMVPFSRHSHPGIRQSGTRPAECSKLALPFGAGKKAPGLGLSTPDFNSKPRRKTSNQFCLPLWSHGVHFLTSHPVQIGLSLPFELIKTPDCQRKG